MAKAVGIQDFFRRLLKLFKQPIFIFVTVWGHICIFLGTGTFHWFESGVNPKITNWLDTFYWGINIVTTVGSTDIHPVTVGGKIVAIFMMIGGSLFLWSYAGLFAGALIYPELRLMEGEIKGIETDVHEMQKDVSLDEAALKKLLHRVERLVEKMEKADGA